jgi:hypothetical protein
LTGHLLQLTLLMVELLLVLETARTAIPINIHILSIH